MTAQDITFQESVSVLDEMRQEYWLCNGTLLGVIRQKQLIPWDFEIDFGVLKEDFSKEKAANAFRRQGFDLHDYGVDSDHITFIKRKIRVDINIFVLNKDKYETLWHIPICSFIERGINKVIRSVNLFFYLKVKLKAASKYSLEGYSIPLDYLMPLINIQFLNQQVMIPKKSEELLEWTYGRDWRTPKKDYDWRVEGANNSHGE